MRASLLLVLIALFAAHSPARADVILRFMPDHGNRLLSAETEYHVPFFWTADDFRFTRSGKIREIQVWMYIRGHDGAPDTWDLSMFYDNAGEPADTSAMFHRTDGNARWTGKLIHFGGVPYYLYRVTWRFDPWLVLGPGRYWIVPRATGLIGTTHWAGANMGTPYQNTALHKLSPTFAWLPWPTIPFCGTRFLLLTDGAMVIKGRGGGRHLPDIRNVALRRLKVKAGEIVVGGKADLARCDKVAIEGPGEHGPLIVELAFKLPRNWDVHWLTLKFLWCLENPGSRTGRILWWHWKREKWIMMEEDTILADPGFPEMVDHRARPFLSPSGRIRIRMEALVPDGEPVFIDWVRLEALIRKKPRQW